MLRPAGQPDLEIGAHVDLEAGDSRRVTLTADPRLLARFDGAAGQWHIAEGTYKVALGKNAEDFVKSYIQKGGE